MNASVASQSKRREENCTERYLRESRNQNGEYLVNLYESDILETSHSLYSELEFYFLLKVQMTKN